MGHGTAAAAGLMLGHSHALSGAVTGLFPAFVAAHWRSVAG